MKPNSLYHRSMERLFVLIAGAWRRLRRRRKNARDLRRINAAASLLNIERLDVLDDQTADWLQGDTPNA
jgi:hypothetical protein